MGTIQVFEGEKWEEKSKLVFREDLIKEKREKEIKREEKVREIGFL